jgi:amidase
MMRMATLLSMGLLIGCSNPEAPTETAPLDVAAASPPQSLTEAMAALETGALSSEALTGLYLKRIAELDDSGPQLNAVIALNPNALEDARKLDAMRARGEILGPLHGAPILIKDNIETLDPIATTAGSLALQDNVTGRDATIVQKLRSAGAVILGKTNLSEWANFRSSSSTSGWSAVGSLTRNPHVLDRNPCGSSSGSAAAAAAALAAATIGTETDGSIVCPAGQNGVVGLKPTVGLVSRTRIIPISASQDTAGPITMTVADAALLLSVIAGEDVSDPATQGANTHVADYTKVLDSNALKGRRIGVARFLMGYHDGVDRAFEHALTELRAAGAEMIELNDPPQLGAIGEDEFTVLLSEFRAGLNAYLASTPPQVKVRSLEELIAFNDATPAELEFFGQDILTKALSAPGLNEKAYQAARDRARRLAGPEGIDRLITRHDLDAIVAPTGGPAWVSDLVTGDHFLGSSSTLPAVAGYPSITVPMGSIRDLPVGITFFGPAWSEGELLGMAYAFEQKTAARITPAFRPTSQ